MMTYDESRLVKTLDTLPKHLRVAFAALCAQRLVPAYVAFAERTASGDPVLLQSILNRLWRDVEGEDGRDENIREDLDACLAVIHDEDVGPWSNLRAYAEDAAAAVAYALRTRQNGKIEDAAWGSRLVYEALDHFVTSREAIGIVEPGAEERVIGDPLIQMELARQWQDLDELRNLAHQPGNGGKISELRKRAEADAYLVLTS